MKNNAGDFQETTWKDDLPALFAGFIILFSIYGIFRILGNFIINLAMRIF